MRAEFGLKKAGSSVWVIKYSEALVGLNVDLGEAAVRDEIKWTTAS